VNPGKKKKKAAEESKRFLKKDHMDLNMVVAIRVRPMNAKELQHDYDIVKS
jgi:hypothetical protein